MTNWQSFMAVYFSFSVTLLFLLLCAKRKLKIEASLTVFEVILTLLLGPIVVFIHSVFDMIYPPSGNLTDIVYSKLSYSEGKTSNMILGEVWDAGESLGWSEKRKIVSTLNFMVSMGYARCEKVSIKNLIVKDLSEFNKIASQISSGELGNVVVISEILTKNVEDLLEDDLSLVPVYFKGIPPRRRKLWDSFFSFGKQWLPVYNRASTLC
jgi:hypothetical protein